MKTSFLQSNRSATRRMPASILTWRRWLWMFAAGALLGAVVPAPAQVFSCNAFLFHTNATPMVISSAGPASRYPSTLHIAGATGTIGHVTVTLMGLSVDIPSALDILLVGPGGQKALLMSDAGEFGLLNPPVTLTFDDSAAGLLPDDVLQSGTYRPTDYAGRSDVFSNPAPPGPYTASLSAFNGASPNGTWSLYVMDQGSGSGGSFLGGWSLWIDYATTNGASLSEYGPASPYPWTVNVSGLTGTVSKVTVNLGLSHSRLDDLDVLLVGPRGQSVMLMSDAGGEEAFSGWLGFDDKAAAAAPDASIPATGSYRPGNYNGGDSEVFSAPAPASPYGSSLGVFKGTDPNGAWSLYIQDDQEFMSGGSCGWTLGLSTEVVPTALDFDGVDDYVSVGHNDMFNAYPLTVTAWIQTTQNPSDAGIVNKYLASSLNGWQLYLWNGEVRAWYFRNGSAYVWDGDRGLNGGLVNDGQWHHVAFTVDATGGKIYVDGSLKQSLGWTGAAGPPTTTQELRLGDHAGSVLRRYYRGLLDEVSIWSVARTEAEILSTMNRPLTGAESNLVAYWRFDEAGGTTANDSSLNVWRGNLLNGPGWAASGSPVAAPVFINEWLALNGNGLMDNFGERDPWLELYNANASAVDLTGYSLTDDLSNRNKFPLPPNTTVPGRGWLLIWADGQTAQTTPSELHANFRVPDGGTLSLFSPSGALVDGVAFGPQLTDLSQGRCPDGAPSIRTLSMPTPAAANLCGDPLAVVMTNIWRYNQSGADLGSAWREPGYDDRTWPQGRALLYNETAPLPAPKNTPLTLGPITYYFRTRFVNPWPFVSNTLFVSTVLDDGAVFYLNGAEISRLRMPPGPIDNTTLANATVADAVFEGPFSLPVTNLVAGTNVLAVEVHQASAGSTDVVFGMTLGTTNPVPLVITRPPSSQTVNAGGTARFTVVASGPEPLSYQWIWNGGILRGQTNAALVLPNAQATNGGAYSVVVAGGGELLASPPAFLRVPASMDILFSDTFNGGDLVDAPARVAETNNAVATAQAGEPNHARQPGGKSMWLSWISGLDGVITFSTHGSDFDTLLAAYTGPDVFNLTVQAAADDTDDRLTSTIRFGVQPGTNYHVAIDGFNGATGRVVLSWSFVETPLAAPMILNAPTNRSVPRGAGTTFSVTAANAAAFQWYFNGSAIPGATAANYSMGNVQPHHCGCLFVRVFNAPPAIVTNAVFVESAPVQLEIGAFPARVSRDKPEDAPPGQGLRPAAWLTPASSNSANSLAVGVLYEQVWNNGSCTRTACETVCGRCVYYPRFFPLPIPAGLSGLTMVVDTKGSPLPAVVKVVHNDVNDALITDGCITDPRQDVRFSARSMDSPYVAVADGLNGAQGLIRVNYGLGTTSTVVLRQTNVVVTAGSPVTLSATTNGIPAPTLQWQASNSVNQTFTNIPGAVSAEYCFPATVTNHYRVVASNFVALATSAVALVTVQMPQAPPVITTHPQSLTVAPGETATFSVGAVGSPPLAYAWQFNGTNIPGAIDSTYTLNAGQCAHAGTYSVRVSNSVGSITSFPAQLEVRCPPPPTLSIQRGGTPPGTLLFLSWPEPSSGYLLQSARTLASPPSATVWSNLGQTTTARTVFPTNAAQFYRLFCPCP